MTVLMALAALTILTVLLRRWHRARRSARVSAALAAVEASAPLVMADWPPAARGRLTSVLVGEERRRSADYRHGMHTGSEGREADYLMLDRVGHALSRVREAEARSTAPGPLVGTTEEV
ncbi:hypothetical protein QYM41_08185 [Kocuria sp. CPCC 205268]|uniref:hypothetical protein n=1 Tax=Kocuria oxytropis TaxID=3058913 RepID=UPI0034D50CEB